MFDADFLTSSPDANPEVGRQLLSSMISPEVSAAVFHSRSAPSVLKFAMGLPVSKDKSAAVFGHIDTEASMAGLTAPVANMKAVCHYDDGVYLFTIELAWGKPKWHIVHMTLQSGTISKERLCAPEASFPGNNMLVFNRIHTNSKKLVEVNMPSPSHLKQMQPIYEAWIARLGSHALKTSPVWADKCDTHMVEQMDAAVREAAGDRMVDKT